MTDENFSAIRARLRYTTLDEFVDGYGRYISRGGMFVPMAAQKLKPVGTTVRFQFLLADGTSAFLGEGVVRQLKGLENEGGGPVGMLVKFTKLSQESKELVDVITEVKAAGAAEKEEGDSEESNTGVIAAKEASNLRQAAGFGDEPHTAEHELDARTRQMLGLDEEEDNTAEAELPADPPELEQEEDETPESSGDEIFGGPESVVEPEAAPAEVEGVESEVGGGISDSWGLSDPEPAEVEGPEGEGEENPFASAFEDADWGFGAPAEEPTPEPMPEELAGPVEVDSREEEEEEEPAVPQGPPAIKETEGGIKVMSFDGVIDDEGTREFEEYAASGADEDFDEVFDNIFGGDGGDLFGGGDEGFGEALSEPALEVSESLLVDEELDLEEEQTSSPPPLEMPSLEAGDEEDAGGEEVSAEPEAREEEDIWARADDPAETESFFEGDSPEEESVEEEEGMFAQQEEADEDLGARDVPEMMLGGDDEESDILSLLDMDEEPGSMTLNLSTGAGLEESSVEELEEDSLKSLLASAKADIESQKADEPDEKRDLLDDLLGDDDLPTPGSAGPAFEVPTPDKKKKKGLMSKLFGK